MFWNDNRALRMLRGVIARLPAEGAMTDDLFQEAVIDLWTQECKNPGQGLSYYLRGCWLNARNSLRLGRSIDSPKRSCNRQLLDAKRVPEAFHFPELVATDPFDMVVVDELLELIGLRLTPREREVLLLLADGMNDTEIARRLHLSRAGAAKRRRKIALVAMTLGIRPISTNSKSSASRIRNGKVRPRKVRWPHAQQSALPR